MYTSILFFKRNFNKFMSIILSLTVFLFMFNLILGFVLTVNNNYKTDVVNNSNLFFMEVSYKDLGEEIPIELKDKIKSISGVKEVFFDYGIQIGISKNKGTSKGFTSVLGVPQSVLSYFGVKEQNDSKKYFYLNQGSMDASNFNSKDKIEINSYKFVTVGNQSHGEEYNINTQIVGKFKMAEVLYFPPDTSLIDMGTAEELAKNLSETGKPKASRIIVIVPKVENLKTISDSISAIDDSLITKYALKTTNSLPKFAVIITTVSSLIVTVLFVICLFTISSNMKQVLILRKRDIALFDILGFENRVVYRIFLFEFLLHGLVTFILSISGTSVVLLIFKALFNFDILTKYIWLYLLSNAIISLILLISVGFFQIATIMKNLNKNLFYKEVLR